MGYKYIASIGLSNIDKIELYVNKSRKSMTKIVQETGCDYALNGGIFSMSSYTMYGNVKSKGIVYCDPNYSEYGYMWNTADIKMGVLPTNSKSYQNYIGCVGMINNSKNLDMYYNRDMGGRRGRSAIGIKGNNLILYCTKDGSSYAKTPEDLRKELLDYGCSSAVMLDGGGSSQCNFKGSVITSSRPVANLILVYLKKSSSKPSNQTSGTSMKDYVKKFQSWMNTNYRMGLAVDGSFGPASKKAAIKTLQTIMNKEYGKSLAIDGSFGPASRAAVPTLSRGKTGNIIYLVQGVLYGRGYNPNGFDGSFGPGMEAAIKKYQSAYKLSATGKITAAVWNRLMNG